MPVVLTLYFEQFFRRGCPALPVPPDPIHAQVLNRRVYFFTILSLLFLLDFLALPLADPEEVYFFAIIHHEQIEPVKIA